MDIINENRQWRINENEAKIKMVCLILTVVGGIIAYLAVFKDAFGGASGFLAVVGVAIFAYGFCPLFGISDEDIERIKRSTLIALKSKN